MKQNKTKEELQQNKTKEELQQNKTKEKRLQNKEKQTGINTPYDDVVRTLLIDQSPLVIPLLNELFEEHYTGEEEIIFSQNEHIINDPNGEQERRVTDASFTVVGKVRKKYILECQSTTDSSMLVRIFEYSTRVALENSVLREGKLNVKLPNCAVIYLRAGKSVPNRMIIELETPDGKVVAYDCKILKMQQYRIEEILQKNLLFLIPFYIFVYDKKLKVYNDRDEKLQQILNEYHTIKEQLQQSLDLGKINTLTYRTIIEMTEKVVDNLAGKYQKIRKGVRNIMGGKVLEYEAKTIYIRGIKDGIKEGKEEGIKEGIKEGKYEAQKEGALGLWNIGIAPEQIAKGLSVSIEQVEEWINEL